MAWYIENGEFTVEAPQSRSDGDASQHDRAQPQQLPHGLAVVPTDGGAAK